MNAEQRIEKLEKTVRHLTIIATAAVSIGVCSVLVGMGQAGAAQSSWGGPHPVGAPENGFVVVPNSFGTYTIIRAQAGEIPRTLSTKWR